MSTAPAQKNDIGTRINIDLGVDTSSATTIKIIVKKPGPGSAAVEWPAESDGTKIWYSTKAGDLDVAGRYSVQAYIEFGSVWKGRSNVRTFKVEENII